MVRQTFRQVAEQAKGCRTLIYRKATSELCRAGATPAYSPPKTLPLADAPAAFPTHIDCPHRLPLLRHNSRGLGWHRVFLRAGRRGENQGLLN